MVRKGARGGSWMNNSLTPLLIVMVIVSLAIIGMFGFVIFDVLLGGNQ